MTILRVERAGACNWEDWRIGTLARKKQRGKVHNTFHSNFNHKNFQLEVSFNYMMY
jgi:hypothetical protein